VLFVEEEDKSVSECKRKKERVREIERVFVSVCTLVFSVHESCLIQQQGKVKVR
jgi:hypothetical protein